jgi:hypothetical protein
MTPAIVLGERSARMRANEMILVFLVACAAIAGWMILARRVLLAWYLREVRALDVPLAADDAIITYPLA